MYVSQQCGNCSQELEPEKKGIPFEKKTSKENPSETITSFPIAVKLYLLDFEKNHSKYKSARIFNADVGIKIDVSQVNPITNSNDFVGWDPNMIPRNLFTAR